MTLPWVKPVRIIESSGDSKEIGARLVRLELSSCDPSALARFHAAAFRLHPAIEREGFACRAPGDAAAGHLVGPVAQLHPHGRTEDRERMVLGIGAQEDRTQLAVSVQDQLGTSQEK